MTAQSLRIDFNKFGAYFLYKPRSLKYCGIMQIILALFSYPFMTICGLLYVSSAIQLMEANERYAASQLTEDAELLSRLRQQVGTLDSLYALSIIICVLCLAAMFIMNFVTELQAFRWLYKKNYVDMDYSLPISGDTRFWGDFLAGFAAANVPHIAAVLIGMAVMSFWQCDPLSMASVYRSASYSSAEVDISWISLMWTGVIACLMFYCFSLLIMACCGKAGHMRVMPLLANVAVPVVHISAFLLSTGFAYGYIAPFGVNELSLCSTTSSFGLIISTVFGAKYNKAEQLDTSECLLYPVQRAELLIPILLLAVCFAVGAWLLIRRRRAEHTGRAYVYKEAQYILQFLIMLAIILPFALYAAMNISPYSEINFTALLSIFFVTFVIFTTMEIAAKGGLKGFGFALLRYAAAIVGSCVISLLLILSEGFGVGRRIPAAEDIAEVWVRPESVENINLLDSYSFSEPDNIELAREIHSEVLEIPPYENVFERITNHQYGVYSIGGSVTGYDVAISYRMKDGSNNSYFYTIDEDTYRDIIRRITVPETLLQSYNGILCTTDFETELPDDDTDNLWITGIGSGYQTTDCTPVTALKATELYDAIKADCGGVSYERLYECRAGEYDKRLTVELTYSSVYDGKPLTAEKVISIFIYPWFESTLALLEQYGVDVDFTVNAQDFNTAFLIKMEPLTDANRYNLIYYSLYNIYGQFPANYLDVLFGLAGDSSYAEYAEKNSIYDTYIPDEKTGEYIYAPIEPNEIPREPYEAVREGFPTMKAVKLDLDSAETETLISYCGGVPQFDNDLDSACYTVVLTECTGEDLISDDLNFIDFMNETVYVAPEHLSFAAALFDRLAG